jgi:hypothetical protein
MKIKLQDKIFCCKPFTINAKRIHTFEKAIVSNVHISGYPILISVLMDNYNSFKLNIDQFNLHFRPIEEFENHVFIKEEEMLL